MFAKIIRRDAREQIRRSTTAVRMTETCCGVRVLLVHYRARPVGSIKQAAYVLSLETKHGVVSGVAIAESAAEVRYESNTGRSENQWNFELAIRHASQGPNAGWSYSDSYSNVARAEGSGGRPSGQELAHKCRLPAPVPSVLDREATLMLESARRHLPSTPALLLSACEPSGMGAG